MKIAIDSITFEDVQLQKAYSDYMYTAEMTDGPEEVSADDLAGIALRYLKQHGKSDKAGTINPDGSCAIKINVQADGENQAWLLMLHTDSGSGCREATLSDAPPKSLKGCITDSLTGMAYPYAVMRITGSGDPLETTKGLVPADGSVSQRETVTSAAKSFADYALGLGLPTLVADEVYHPGFSGSLMETAAVISAVPAVNLRGEEQSASDVNMLLEFDEDEQTAAADADTDAAYMLRVGRLFRDGEAARMIKDCSADSEGRICCRTGAEHEEMLRGLAEREGLCCRVTEDACKDPELNSDADTDADAEAPAQLTKGASLHIGRVGAWSDSYLSDGSLSFSDAMRRIAEDLNTCSGRGLTERFDSTAGRRTVMMPLGGVNQLAPMQSASCKIPVQRGTTDDCTVAAWGYNPYINEASPYHGGYLAVIESIAKLVATGATFNEIYVSLQRNFSAAADETGDSTANGAEFAALLGAFEAEMGLGVPAVSSNSAAQDMPALISFAVTMGRASELISTDFKAAGHRVVMLMPEICEDTASAYYGLPTPESLKNIWRKAYELIANGRAVAAYTPGIGGIAEAVMKMCYGGGVGFEFSTDLANELIFGYSYGAVILEMATDETIKSRLVRIADIGYTTDRHIIGRGSEVLSIGELLMLYEGRLESVYAANADSGLSDVGNVSYAARSWHTPIFKRARPRLLIPVLSNVTSEDDIATAAREAGADAEILALPAGSEEDMLRASDILADALSRSQIMVLDTALAHIFREDNAAEALGEFMDRKDGLILGIGDGFKTLLELGLLPCGDIMVNSLGAYQSRIARVRVASNKSPWLRSARPGDIYSLPVSCAFGRFTASDEEIRRLAVNGQIATQYADSDGNASADIRFNPSGSVMAIEAVTSEDGRIMGRMGRVERSSEGLYRNVPGNYLSGIFENAVRYFR